MRERSAVTAPRTWRGLAWLLAVVAAAAGGHGGTAAGQDTAEAIVPFSCNVTRFTVMPRGGPFAALEEPEIYLDEVRAFFGDLQ